MKILSLFFLLLPALCLSEDEVRYTVTELEILARQQRWSEIIIHMAEVPVADRNKKFEKIVEEASIHYLEEAAREPGGMDGIANSLLQKYPFLRGSKAFMQKRALMGAEALDICYQVRPKEECMGRAIAFVNEDVTNREIREWVCNRPAFKQSLLTALHASDDKQRVEAAQMVEKNCWAEMKTLVQNEFHKEKLPPRFLASACPVLKNKGSLGPHQRKCSTFVNSNSNLSRKGETPHEKQK